MLNRLIKILIASIVLAVLPVISFLPAQAEAQVGMSMPYTLSNELGVEVVPTYPRPNEKVFISLTLYSDDLNSADIAWYINGKNELQGKGKVNYSFKIGRVGEETKVEIRVKLQSGTSFSKSFTLNPASVDITWEANSYVPPFYKGKALHPRQGSLKLVAMPEFIKNGKRIAPENLIYKWSNGINIYQDQSGYGKNVVVVNGSLLGKTENIEVLVTDPVNNLVAQSFLDISPTDPQIVFYENDPYYGHIFDEGLAGNFDLKNKEVQILAAPYYFTKESSDLLKYNWQLNGQEIPSLSDSLTAVFRKPEKETGTSNVLLRVENLDRILQQAEGSLIMQFQN